MQVITSSDADTYANLVRPFLQTNEAEYGLLLGSLEQLQQQPANSGRFMAYVRAGAEIVFAAIYREGYLILSHGPSDAVHLTAQKLLEAQIDIPGVFGPAREADVAALDWQRLRGCTAFLAADQLLYRLTALTCPTGIPGRMRCVEARDIELLTLWEYGFHRDALPHEPFSAKQARERAERRIPAGMSFIWEVDRLPVAMAALARPSTHGVAVNAVYTPPEHRRKGYASALVAAVTAEGLSRGKSFCTLYADQGNPSADHIYRKLGYEPIAKCRTYCFRYV